MLSGRALSAVVAVAVIAAVGACSDDTGGAIQSPTSVSTAGGSTTIPVDPLPGASTTPVSTPRGSQTALLTDVRAGAQVGFDRVVFQFERDLPGYSVAYTDKPIHEDTSGHEVPVAGNHVLLVRAEPAATADLSGAALRQTYAGPNRVPATAPEVTEVVKTGDFEAVLTWAIGVRDKLAFKVSKLSNPSRLVVDIRST